MSVFVLVRGGCARRRDPARGDAAQREWVLRRHTDYPPHGLVEPGRLSEFLAILATAEPP